MADWRRALRRGRSRLLFLSVRTLVRCCSFAGVRQLGAALGAIQYCFGGRDRRRCLRDLALLQNRAPGDPLVVRQLQQAYRFYTVATLEVVAMLDRKLDAERLRTVCRIDGLPELEAARSGGAILLATHSGNTLLAAAQLASAGWPVTVVYRQSRMMSADLFTRGLPQYGIDGILANQGVRAYANMLRALRQNRILFVMIDQGVKSAKDGLPMRFLGKDMPMPAGPALLARRTGAPILPLVTVAAEPVWHFVIEPPVPCTPDGTVEEDTEKLLRVVERQVLERPQLWSWQYRRWRKFPLAAPSP